MADPDIHYRQAQDVRGAVRFAASPGARRMHEQSWVVPQCLICWEPLHSSNQCKHCRRSACKECLRTFLTSRILQGNVDESFLACPNYDCGVPFPSEELQEILSEQSYTKLTRLRLISTVNRDPNRCWCPNRECGAAVDLRQTFSVKYMTKQSATCGSCGGAFCPRCGSLPHRGNCPRDASYVEWVSKTERAGEDGVQPCPRCHHHIEKRGGCQHMSCSMCAAEWCWLCRCQWRGHHMAMCRAVSLYRHKAWGRGPIVRTATMTAALPVGLCAGGAALAAGTVLGVVYVVGVTGYFAVIVPGKSAKASVCRTWQRTREAMEKRRPTTPHGDVPEDDPEEPVPIA